MDKIYGGVARKLTDWENHRTQTEWDDALISKSFVFQFVNSYGTLFYIAFWKKNAKIFGFDDHCVNGDCIKELYSQLIALMITRLVISQTLEVLSPFIQRHLSRCVQWGKAHASDTDGVVHKMRSVEKQRLDVSYDSTFDDYNELVLQFGYVTMFASAFPLAPLLALVNNVVEIRTDGLRILMSSRRCRYKAVNDIGAWQRVLELIGLIAVITNSLLFALSSSQLPDIYNVHDRVTRLWVAIVVERAILIAKALIMMAIPDVPGHIRKRILQERFLEEHFFRAPNEQDPLSPQPSNTTLEGDGKLIDISAVRSLEDDDVEDLREYKRSQKRSMSTHRAMFGQAQVIPQ
eukprot:TRINITY_DN3168_c0_g1_i2.p1 TRINITY_DN3168_c0_g1~~TRINITY_DN3168_c0_g1_i2.p1  ORF type:complete len:348 (-),score=70.21 TRINITY_DN3168_c0_g1_i2:26-1069(-)